MTPLDQLLNQLGITYRQLDFWIRQGYLKPRHDGGSGKPRDFTGEELEVAQRMSRLVNRGFTPYAAARVARASVEEDTTLIRLGAGIYVTIHDEQDQVQEVAA